MEMTGMCLLIFSAARQQFMEGVREGGPDSAFGLQSCMEGNQLALISACSLLCTTRRPRFKSLGFKQAEMSTPAPEVFAIHTINTSRTFSTQRSRCSSIAPVI